MSLELLCDCVSPLQSPVNEKCNAPNYGNQIVKFFFQKETGTDFDGTGVNDATVEANWLLKIAADDDDRISVIKNLASTKRPSSEPNIESGNDVTYGGEEVIDRPQMIEAALKYLSQEDFTFVNRINCWGQVRMWFLDNNDWMWCASISTGEGFPSVSVNVGTYAQEGIGTKNRLPIKVTYNNICQPVPFANLPFLRNIEASNESGSEI